MVLAERWGPVDWSGGSGVERSGEIDIQDTRREQESEPGLGESSLSLSPPYPLQTATSTRRQPLSDSLLVCCYPLEESLHLKGA